MMVLNQPHVAPGATRAAPSGLERPDQYAASRETGAIWLLLAAVAILDAASIIAGGFHLILAGLAAPALVVFALMGGAWLLRSRSRNPPAIALLGGAAQIITCFALCGVLSYLVSSTERPFVDRELATLDGMMGFDWPRYVAWVQARPALDSLLSTAYSGTIIEMTGIAVLLGAVRRERVQELSATILIALLLTIAISGIFPAVDAWAHYGPAHPELIPEMTVHDLIPLRDGTLRQIDLRRVEGLITFPSFHTILSLLFIYVLRGIRVAFPASLVMNLTIILATLTAGGHYLTDLLGGAAVTVISIALYRAVRLAPRQPAGRGAAQPPGMPPSDEGLVIAAAD